MIVRKFWFWKALRCNICGERQGWSTANVETLRLLAMTEPVMKWSCRSEQDWDAENWCLFISELEPNDFLPYRGCEIGFEDLEDEEWE